MFVQQALNLPDGSAPKSDAELVLRQMPPVMYIRAGFSFLLHHNYITPSNTEVNDPCIMTINTDDKVCNRNEHPFLRTIFTFVFNCCMPSRDIRKASYSAIASALDFNFEWLGVQAPLRA